MLLSAFRAAHHWQVFFRQLIVVISSSRSLVEAAAAERMAAWSREYFLPGCLDFGKRLQTNVTGKLRLSVFFIFRGILEVSHDDLWSLDSDRWLVKLFPYSGNRSVFGCTETREFKEIHGECMRRR